MKRILFLILLPLLLIASSCQADDPVNEPGTGSAAISDTTSDISDTVSQDVETEPELTWFYDAQRESTPAAFPMDTGEYPDEIKNTYLSFPSEFETVYKDMFHYKIEFHDEKVYMHEYILVRMTITNICDTAKQLQASNYNAGYFLRDDGETLINRHHTGPYSDSADFFSIMPGKSEIHELKFYMDHDFFQSGHTYTYVKSADPYLVPDPVKTFEIPITINVTD